MAREEEEKRAKSNNVPSTYINLKVSSQTQTEVSYKVKRNKPLKRLMDTYCERMAVEHNTYVFLYNGHRVKGRHTPDMLEMEDGDEIDAMLHQGGGGGEPVIFLT